jgi:flagellar motility protein MotE (MotC chaperone)
MQFRLFPFIIFACLLLLLVKAADFLQGERLFSENLLVSSGYAESDKEEKPHDKKEENKEEKKEHGKEEGKEEKKEGEHGAEGDKSEKKDKEKDKKGSGIKVSEKPPEQVIKVPEGPQFTPEEVEVLQRLRQRRDQLDAREKELEVREKVLRVTEGKIDQKFADLTKLKDDVQLILNSYNEKEELKLLSLVKIYENMKPKDAAKIFEELDMKTLLPVIAKMKEAKVAPVLAQMDPKKAKDVTTELSLMRKIPTTAPAVTK